MRPGLHRLPVALICAGCLAACDSDPKKAPSSSPPTQAQLAERAAAAALEQQQQAATDLIENARGKAGLGAHEEAIALYERALEILRHNPAIDRKLTADCQARGTAVINDGVLKGPGSSLHDDGDFPVHSRVSVLGVDPVGRIAVSRVDEGHRHAGRCEVSRGQLPLSWWRAAVPQVGIW